MQDELPPPKFGELYHKGAGYPSMPLLPGGVGNSAGTEGLFRNWWTFYAWNVSRCFCLEKEDHLWEKKMKWDVKNYIIHILKSFGFHVSCRGCILVILLEHQWVEGSFVRNHSTNLDPPILGMQMKKVVEIHPPETKQRRNAWIFGSILSINGYVHLWHWNWIVFSARPRHLTAMVSCPSFSALPGEALDTKGQRNVACGYHWGWTYSTGSIPKWQSFT